MLSAPPISSEYSVFLNLSYLIIDYYFDNPENTTKDKYKLAQFIQKRILESNVKPYDLYSNKFNKAISDLELKYPRKKENNVIYSTIYDMFMVEKESMESESNDNYSDEDLLLVMAKKGIQTLFTITKIAEFETNKNLNDAQSKFMIKLGFLTQIIDDLCDINNDISSNCKTYYVQKYIKRNDKLDKHTYTAINYLDNLCNDLETNNYFNHSEQLNKNITKGLYFVINLWLMYGVCKNKKYYTEECYANIEKYSLLSFDDLRSIRNSSKPRLLKLIKV